MYTCLAPLHFRRLLKGQWPSLSSQFTYRHRGSLSRTLRGAERVVCLLLEGIVSLSRLSDQVAALNGHRIKATSLGKRVYIHTHTHIYIQTPDALFICTHPHAFTRPVLWQDPFTVVDSNALPGERQVLSLAAWYNMARTTWDPL